ncbi:hypothetical protein KP509_13G019900 [Ceratopteris richardii]|nr:hypothetical protein KP509_13G019900 [Ceratopteris richardii]
MDVLPLKKVKLLGGKVGEELSIKWNCKTAGEVQKIPLNALLASFGDRLGNYVYKAVRGIHEDKVQEKQTTKSMLAAKSFQATNDLSVVRTWLGVLAEELSVRMWRDVKENHRQPHSLQLYYRSGTSRQSGDHSKSCSMPNAILQLLSSACLGAPRTTTKQKNGDSSGFSENCNSNLNNKEEINLEKPAESDKFIPIVDYSIFNDTVRDLSKPKEDCGGCGLPQEETVRMPAHDCARSVPEESGSENEETVKNLSRLLQQASFDLFQRIDDGFPCTRLAIAASSFHDAPAQGSQSIEHFFGSSSSHVPSVKINTEVSISDDKTVNKQKGMLKYFGSDPSKPFERPLESGMLHHEREDMEKRIQVGILNDETTDNCGGYCVDHNISSLEDVGSSLAFISKENLINSDRSPEDTSDQRGCTTDSHVDLEDIDVDEQCRIWNDIRKMRSASGAKSMPLNDSLVDTTGVHKAKRRKSKPVNPESGQLPLSKFFRS